MNSRRSILRSLWLIPALITTATANDWPNWRGPNQNGSIATGAFPAKWTTNNIQWKTKLPGKGTSVPIVHAKNIYLTSPSSGQDAVLAFDLTGKKLWESKLGPEAPPKHR